MAGKINSVRRLTAALLAATVILMSCFAVFAAGDVTSSRNGVALISTTVPNDQGTYSFNYSTAFFVSPEYLLTTYDAISALDQIKTGKLEVIYDRSTVQEASIAAVDTRKNLALLKLPSPTTLRTPLALNLESAVNPGDTLYAVIHEDCESGDLSAMLNSITMTSGILSRSTVETSSGRKVLQMDFASRDSSPVLNENGEVVGIASDSLSYANNTYSAINISEAATMLSEYDVVKKDFLADNLAVIIVVVIVILAAVAAFFFYRSRQTKKKADEAQKAKSAAAVAQAAQKGARKPMLYCMTGEHNGLKMNLQGQKILFGRDVASCRVVFKPGTPGISKAHCELYYDDARGQFILTDQKSTYGTFLANGQQLTPAVAYNLNAKDSFYLGEKDNTFFVDMES